MFQRAQVSLHIWLLVWSDRQRDGRTMSPIELFWTAKNIWRKYVKSTKNCSPQIAVTQCLYCNPVASKIATSSQAKRCSFKTSTWKIWRLDSNDCCHHHQLECIKFRRKFLRRGVWATICRAHRQDGFLGERNASCILNLQEKFTFHNKKRTPISILLQVYRYRFATGLLLEIQ